MASNVLCFFVTPVGYRRMSEPSSRDYFHKARTVTATVLFAAGLAAIVGSLLDWIVVAEVPPSVPEDQMHRLPPFTGIEVDDGWVVIGAALVVLVSAFFIVLKGRFAGWALLGCIVIGGIAISNYRTVSEIHLALEGIGRDPRPGSGLTLVTVAGLVGSVAAAGAMAASPRPPSGYKRSTG
jgi:hypothetical protein